MDQRDKDDDKNRNIIIGCVIGFVLIITFEIYFYKKRAKQSTMI